MALRGRLQEKAIRYGEEAGRKAITSVPVRVAGDGLRGFRGMLDGGGGAVTVELFLLSLVRAMVCDLADFHEQDLSDDRIVAHMLVLWEIADNFETAHSSVQGSPPVAGLLGEKLSLKVDEHLPEELTKRSIAKALWEVREGVGNARKGATSEAVRTVAFTGHRTKKTIKRMEAQLGVGQ